MNAMTNARIAAMTDTELFDLMRELVTKARNGNYNRVLTRQVIKEVRRRELATYEVQQ